MRPSTTSLLLQLDVDPTLESFAQVANSALGELLPRLGVSQVTVHMQGGMEVDPGSTEFLGLLRDDLERYGKAVLTVRWGDNDEDDWETVCLVGGLGATMKPTIAALWMGQDAHEKIKHLAASSQKPVLH